MASFATDLNSLKFNPYVQELPVEALTSVGVAKQTAYNEGIQKIQSTIDNVAGMDIIRDVDKNYLQTKLNKLGSDLKAVAAGDFSNFQLVNSVGSMTTGIAKDPNITRALSSTITYRKDRERLQKDIDDGKYNPANKLRFDSRANRWLNSTNIDDSYNSSYLHPIDVWGKIKDIAKEVGINESDIQQLYQTDERGNVIYDSKGNAKWNPIMAEKILKEKDSSVLLKAFQNALTPADFEQLAIEGEYNYANYSSERLLDEVITSSATQRNFIKKQIEDLKIALVQENSKNKKDEDIKSSLNDQLGYFENLLQKLDNSINNSVSAISINPDAVRGSLYTNNYLIEMSKVLSSKSITEKYSVSPMHTVTMDQNRLFREIEKDKLDAEHWDKEYELKKRGVELQELEAGKKSISGENFVKEPIPINPKTSYKKLISEEYSNNVTMLNDMNKNLTLMALKEIIPNSENKTQSDYNLYLRKQLEEKAKENGMTVDEYSSKIASDMLTKWKTDPSKMPVQYISYMEKLDELSKQTELQKLNIESKKKEAEAIAKERGINFPSDSELLGMASDTTIRYMGPGLKWYQSVITKDDILNAALADGDVKRKLGREKITVFTPGSIIPTTVKVGSEKSDIAKKKLQDKYGDVYENVLYEIKKLPSYKNIIDAFATSNYKEMNKIEEELYKNEASGKQAISEPILSGKEDREDVFRRISNVVEKYKGTTDISKEDMQQALMSSDNKGIRITSIPNLSDKEPTKFNLQVTPKDGKTISMEIDADDYSVIMRKQAKVNTEKPMIIQYLDNGGTTSRSGDDNPKTAYFSQKDFSKLKDYSATANYIQDVLNPDIVWLKVYLYDKKGNYIDVLTFPDPNDKTVKIKKYNSDGSYNTELENVPQIITDDLINELLNRE